MSCGFPGLTFVRMKSKVGVASISAPALGVGVSVSCLLVFLGSYTQTIASCVGVVMPTVGAFILGSCVCHPEGQVSLNIKEIIIPNPKTFTTPELRTISGFVIFAPEMSSPEKITFALVVFFLLRLEFNKTSSSGLKPRTDLGSELQKPSQP